MNNDTYIKLQDRNLIFLFSIFEYEELPIVFVCRDESWSLYLCDCTETRFSEQNWIIAKTEIRTLEDVANGKLAVYDALKTHDNQVILVVYDYETKEFSQKKCKFTEVEEENLPDKDSRLSYVNSRIFDDLRETELRQIMKGRKSIIIDSNEQPTFSMTVEISTQVKMDFPIERPVTINFSIERPSFDDDDGRRRAA